MAERGARRHARKYASNPEWAAEHNARASAWKKANREKTRAHRVKWAKNNPEKKRAAFAKWRDKDPAKAKEIARKSRLKRPKAAQETVRKWMASNPERGSAMRRRIKANRRARVTTNGGVIAPGDIEQLFTASDGRCRACRMPRDSLEVDHIVPLAKGGFNGPPNLQLLCRSCNASKSDRDFADWAKSKGYA